jgi:hypothetical protein
MSVIDDNMLVTATHGIILLSTIGGVVSSLLNRKKLNKIEISINGGLADKIRTAIKEARDAP